METKKRKHCDVTRRHQLKIFVSEGDGSCFYHSMKSILRNLWKNKERWDQQHVYSIFRRLINPFIRFRNELAKNNQRVLAYRNLHTPERFLETFIADTNEEQVRNYLNNADNLNEISNRFIFHITNVTSLRHFSTHLLTQEEYNVSRIAGDFGGLPQTIGLARIRISTDDNVWATHALIAKTMSIFGNLLGLHIIDVSGTEPVRGGENNLHEGKIMHCCLIYTGNHYNVLQMDDTLVFLRPQMEKNIDRFIARYNIDFAHKKIIKK
jgi:hypothetical protein